MVHFKLIPSSGESYIYVKGVKASCLPAELVILLDTDNALICEHMHLFPICMYLQATQLPWRHVWFRSTLFPSKQRHIAALRT